MTEETTEPPRKGRSNAIVTYETLAGIEQGLTRAILGIERLDEKLTDSNSSMRETLSDHETRLRILEAKQTTTSGGTAALGGLYHAIWPLASFAFGLIVYFTSK